MKILPFDKLESTKKERLIGFNLVWCNGLFITGKGYWFMTLAISLIIVPNMVTIYLISSSDINSDFRAAALFVDCAIMTVVLCCVGLSGCRDPGILKRKISNPIRSKFELDYRTEFKYVKSGYLVQYNLCYTCNIIRPLRTSHCAECDNCTERFDHHCIWIGQCVGKRNYKHFIFFLISLNISAAYQLIIASIILALQVNLMKITSESLLHIGEDSKQEDILFNLKKNIGLASFELLFLLLFCSLFITKLLIQHLYLACHNITFYEFLKKKINTYQNPFHKGSLFSNLKFLLFRRTPKGSLELNHVYYDPLEYNPLESDNMIKTY